MNQHKFTKISSFEVLERPTKWRANQDLNHGQRGHACTPIIGTYNKNALQRESTLSAGEIIGAVQALQHVCYVAQYNFYDIKQKQHLQQLDARLITTAASASHLAASLAFRVCCVRTIMTSLVSRS